MRALLLVACLALHTIQAHGAPAGGVRAGPEAVSATAEAIYRDAKPRLLQIRTLLNSASQKSSTGSGFLVSADGLAITNYHVVSQHALEPQTYRMEYVSADGSRGTLRLLAFDTVNDLALVRLDRGGWRPFEFDARALADQLPRGERLFSLGNPLDIGFAVMEGNYSGLVERSYNERIHLSGPMNPGMSGGPTLTTGSKIAGINVAKIGWGAEQVSFLVPAKFAAALLQRPHLPEGFTGREVRAEIGRQVNAWQAGLYKSLQDKGFKPTTAGPFRLPESNAGYFTCWANTNADDKPAPRARADTTQCNMQNWLFIAGDLYAGNVAIQRTHFTNQSLNSFQFANFVSGKTAMGTDRANPKRMTPAACHEDVAWAGAADAASGDDRLRVRVAWCASAYRDFEGLYNVSFMAVAPERDGQAASITVFMNGTDYANAAALAKRLLAEFRTGT
ncbi:MAG: trypsin-like peptidase domain-containing protein [Betaproteobacteria bacterium]|nr:trypsin-like peptidase domain-containing protein [Betaproteobacteria bacterium]